MAATAEYTSETAAVHSNPHINALLWGGWRWNGTINYYFNNSPFNWSALEKNAYREALQSWANVANISIQETSNQSSANFVEALYSDSPGSLGQHQTPQHGYGQNGQAFGYYNYQGYGWDWQNSNGGLQKGGFGYLTLVHELGHGLGLAHPHDSGGGSTPFPGVDGSPFSDMGNNNLNQDVYTVMSYVHGVMTKPVSGTAGANNYGYIAGPSAFDIAAIQFLYGANTGCNAGDHQYVLPTANASGTFWTTIWDAGGTDTIRHDGSAAATIDLRAATLLNAVGGGGYASQISGIYGGFTIANGVYIENASGGSGGDALTGNDWANGLWGNGGNDTIYGNQGNDFLSGGSGSDYLRGDSGADTIYSGTGNDIYAFVTDGQGGDFWPDFDYVNDQIQISQAGFGVSSVVFQNGREVIAGADRTFLWDKRSGEFAFDVNGSNNGGKTVLATIVVNPTGTSVDNSWSVAGTGDFNNDGHDDIIWRNNSGDALIWQMQNNTRVDGHGLGNVDTSWQLMAFGDFNGDGTDDLVWQNTQNREVHSWQVNNHQKTNGIGLGEIDNTWQIQGAGDFNGDGTDDLFFRNSVTDLGLVWLMQGGQKLNGYGLGYIDNSWVTAGIGDFNNDGTDDIAFRNVHDGALLIWKIANASKVDGYGQGAVDTSWSVASTSDTDNDGHADIVWHNAHSGEVAKWGVVNFGKTSGTVVAETPSGWSVAGSGDHNNNNVTDLLWRNADGSLVTSAYNVWNQADLFASDITLV